MANIKDLKKRIKSTKGTHKITRAMKLVSAAKLAKAQQKIVGLRPYSLELENTIKTVAALSRDYQHRYFNESDVELSYLLVISSDKGLCGAYNGGLVKAVRQYLAQGDNHKTTKLCFIGKKAKEVLEDEVNFGKYYKFAKAEPNLDEIREIAQEFSALFTTGEIGRVFIAFNSFQSAISCAPVIKQVLPLALTIPQQEEMKLQYPFDFKYEPNAHKILDDLIPQVFVNTIQTCIHDAIASEHGMRMSAMENASKNCKEMIRTLTLRMNKLRQAAITTELIEVVSGAESLKS